MIDINDSEVLQQILIIIVIIEFILVLMLSVLLGVCISRLREYRTQLDNLKNTPSAKVTSEQNTTESTGIGNIILIVFAFIIVVIFLMITLRIFLLKKGEKLTYPQE